MNEKDGEKFAAKIFKADERGTNTVLFGKGKNVHFEVDDEDKYLSCKSITEVDVWEIHRKRPNRYLGKCTHTWHFHTEDGHLITDDESKYPDHHPVCKIGRRSQKDTKAHRESGRR